MKITVTNTSKKLTALLTTAGYTSITSKKGTQEIYEVEILVPTGGNATYIESMVTPATITTSRPLVAGTPFLIKIKDISNISLITGTTQDVFITLS